MYNRGGPALVVILHCLTDQTWPAGQNLTPISLHNRSVSGVMLKLLMLRRSDGASGDSASNYSTSGTKVFCTQFVHQREALRAKQDCAWYSKCQYLSWETLEER